MTKVTILVPMTVECTLTPVSQSTEAAFGVFNTDVFEITDIVPPARITIGFSQMAVITDTLPPSA